MQQELSSMEEKEKVSHGRVSLHKMKPEQILVPNPYHTHSTGSCDHILFLTPE